MRENPYQAPAEEPPFVRAELIGEREVLRAVASYQKGLVACIIVYLCILLKFFVDPIQDLENRFLAIFMFLGIGVTSCVYVYQVGIRIYHTFRAIIFALATILPGIGLLSLLWMMFNTNRYLKRNGIKVGILGASISDI